MKHTFFFITFLAGVAAGLFLPRAFRYGDGGSEECRADTVYVRGTIVKTMPATVHKTVTEKITVRVTDTLRIRDTLYIELPRTQKEYADTDYRAWVSGYEPRLDSLKVFPVSTVVTVHAPQKRWGLGVQAGVGLSVKGLTPYVGVGVSYNLLSF